MTNFFSFSRATPALAYSVAALLGTLAFITAFGNPLDVLAGGLMIDTDYPNAAAAFEIFVRDSWRWPLGASPHFGGINIFFSDGAPWFALLSKTLLSLTGVFLNFHWLLVINVLLFALMARRLAMRIAVDEAVRWLITALLVFSLIMPVRMLGAQHLSLSAYWVVLWAMCCVPLLDEAPKGWRRWEFLVAAGIAILSHAYLGAMAITIVCVALLFERRWWATLSALLLPILLLYVLGVFADEHATTEGAKAYSLDLAAFTETLGWGILPNLYEIPDPTQSDAILYLGTGAWALFFIAVFSTIVIFIALSSMGKHTSPLFVLRGKSVALLTREVRHVVQQDAHKRRLMVLFVAAFLLMLYAMTFDIRIAGVTWLSLDIPSLFEPLYERFRVTGRFAGPMAYVLIIILALLWGRLRPRLPGSLWFAVAGLVVVLQWSDLWHAATKSPPGDWLEDAARQREAVASVLEKRDWSGRVFKAVGYFELEQQRLLDRLLVDYGARHFEVVHGARLDPDNVKARSGYEGAQGGDAVVLYQQDDGPGCQAQATIKAFTLCLVK